MKRLITGAALVLTATMVTAAPAIAQTIPMHSGHMGHGSAQMRVHGSGLHYPNRPKHHHHYGIAGYRPTHPAQAPRIREANEAPYLF